MVSGSLSRSEEVTRSIAIPHGLDAYPPESTPPLEFRQVSLTDY